MSDFTSTGTSGGGPAMPGQGLQKIKRLEAELEAARMALEAAEAVMDTQQAELEAAREALRRIAEPSSDKLWKTECAVMKTVARAALAAPREEGD